MTVSSQTNNATFVGNGVTTVFPLPFRFFANGDVFAYFIDPTTGASTPMVLGTDYTLAGAGEPEVNGNAVSVLTTTAPLANGRGLYVERIMQEVQSTDIVNQGEFFASTHEDVFDRLTMLIQQANANSNGAIRVAIGDPEPQRLPPSAHRALKLLSFDANGQPVVTSPASGSATDLELRLADAITPSNGAGLVGYKGRTVYDRLAEIVSVKDHGAACDGITNDSAALALADADAVSRKVPLLITGTLHCPDPVTIKSELVPTNSQIFTTNSNITIDNRSPILPEWFGASSISASQPALAAAVRAVAPGGVLKLSQKYPVIGTGTEILLVDRPMLIVGTGIAYSGLQVKAGTGTGIDVIRISPNMALSDGEGYALENFAITADSPALGRHAVNLDITALGQRLKNLMIQRVRFEQLSSTSIVTTNPLPNIDSVFTSTIRDSVIVGGIDFNNAGDSLRVENCTLTGQGWGVKFKLIPGANKPKVADCNITSKSGAVFVDGPTDPVIINNNIEALSVNDNPDSSFITITGTAPAPARNTQITGNIFGMLADAGVPRVLNAVVVKFADHTIIEKNQFNRAVPGSQKSFNISSGARYTCVGTNNDGNGTLESGYFDAGFDSRGTVVLLSPLAGYTEFNSAGNWDGLKYIKDPSGDNVNLSGAVVKTVGTWTDGDAFLTIPPGARPKLIRWFACSAFETGVGYVTVNIRIESNGAVSAFGVTGRTFTWVSINGITYSGFQ